MTPNALAVARTIYATQPEPQRGAVAGSAARSLLVTHDLDPDTVPSFLAVAILGQS